MLNFVQALRAEFERVLGRIVYRRRPTGRAFEVALNLVEQDQNLLITLTHPTASQTLSIPIPHRDTRGNWVLGVEVIRSVGTWFLPDRQKELSFWELMLFLLIDRIETYFPGCPGVGKRSQLEKMMLSFEFEKAPSVVRNTQRLINDIVNRLPISGTPLQTWAMNNRVVFIDPTFDTLPPNKLLQYQAEKAKAMFPWTFLGLSDSTMVKNYMLKADLRKLTPFGIKHHNPMRNLYQPLGMEGPELPAVTTKSALALEKRGIVRGGYNWLTAFMDLPLTFEDQIIISAKHQSKVNTTCRCFLAFGDVKVSLGDLISDGAVLSEEPGHRALVFYLKSELATVVGLEKRTLVIDGVKKAATVIRVELKRSFKDGFKFTNLHGNKGVAVFADTGAMYHQAQQRYIDIDVIVGAKSVGSRKNYGQVFEALTTLITGPNKRTVLSDEAFCGIDNVKAALKKEGLDEDGVSEIKTRWGTFKTLCGWVFWGIIREPEDSVWTRRDVSQVDQLGLRGAGNKISHIELRGLTTLFGPGSKVVQEVLSHQEGTDIAAELIKVLKSFRGEQVLGVPEIPWKALGRLPQQRALLHKLDELSGTVADPRVGPEGFMLRLPSAHKTVVPETVPPKSFTTETVYVPFRELREPWQHPTGSWGVGDTAGFVNSILLGCDESEKTGDPSALQTVLNNYMKFIGRKLSTKTGVIATQTMAVRYPHSTKGTATVASPGSLPRNTIQIHEDMAKDLGVSHGDCVLVERFPCLGFMSLRPQRVWVTNDPNCRYVIRVSGNSLASLALDFDGDVLFLMAFRTEGANVELEYELLSPNEITAPYINEASNKKVPITEPTSLGALVKTSLKNGQPPMSFAVATADVHVAITKALAGIKTGTGSVVSLGYNVTRLVEGETRYDDTDISAGIEVILDKVANSVFGSKHAVTRLLETQA